MAKWIIYDKDGEAKHESVTNYDSNGKVVSQDTLEYSGKWMGECYLTVSIKSPYPIDFQIGDYIDYRGERFTINYDPSAIKKARRGTYGEGFVYDSIKFNSYSNELTEIRFHDWVLFDNQIHYTSLPNFSFYCKDVDDLADRLQANTDRWCKANGFAKEDYWVFYTLRNNTASGTKDNGQTQTTYERTVQRAKDVLESCGVGETNTAYTKFTTSVQSQWEKIYGAGDNYKDSRDDERYDRNISASGQSVWDMMAAIKQQFGLNFIIRGRNVYIGTAGIPTNHIFKYGKGNGLYEIDKSADQDQNVVTKLHAYGSNENLPTRYYASINKTPYAIVTALKYVRAEDSSVLVAEFYIDVPASSQYLSNKVEGTISVDMYQVEVIVGSYKSIYAQTFIQGDTGNQSLVRAVFYQLNADGTYNTDYPGLVQQALIKGATITFGNGIKKDAWPVDHITVSGENIPDNMAVNYLMLPGFPANALSDICRSEYDSTKDVTNYYITKPGSKIETLFHTENGEHLVTFSTDRNDPYLLSPNVEELGVKEGDIFCNEENDDNGLKKVSPTLEEMTDATAGVGSTGARLDAVLKADTIEDNGVWPQNEQTELPGFNIYLPAMGFDLQQAAQDAGGNDVKISMKNGFCGGRTFSVSSITPAEDGTWKLNCKRAKDDDLDLYFPYSYAKSVSKAEDELKAMGMDGAYQILAGDNYVLTGIYISDTNYVWAASVKLLAKAIHWLCDNDYTRYVYQPKIDEIYMARQNADAKKNGDKSLYENIKEGDLLVFSDEDLRLNGSVYIEQLNIKENGNNGIPTYDVTLRDEIQVGTLQRIQNTVDSIKTDIERGNVGGGVSPTQIDPLVKAYGDKYFLSKTDADTAQGKITFANGAEVKNGLTSDEITNNGNITNKGSIVNSGDISNGGSIRTRNLYVTGTAHFNELSIDKVTASGGAHLFSAADGFKIIHVEEVKSNGTVTGYKLYWLAQDDDGKSIMNMWKSLDQALCMNFNAATAVAEGETSHTPVTNKYWWAAVTDVSGDKTETIQVNNVSRICNWIIVSTTNKAANCTVNPEVGDEVVQLGYRGADDPARQSAILDSSYTNTYDSGLTPPFRAYYRGINNFDLPTHRYSYFDANSAVLKGVSITQLNDTSLQLEVSSSLGYSLDLGTTSTLTCTIVDALGNDRTSIADSWSIERDSGDATADAAWQEKDKVKAFNALSQTNTVTFDIAYTAEDGDIPIDKVTNTIFSIKAYDATGTAIPAGKARKTNQVFVAQTNNSSSGGSTSDEIAALKAQINELAAKIDEAAYIEVMRKTTKVKTKS